MHIPLSNTPSKNVDGKNASAMVCTWMVDTYHIQENVWMMQLTDGGCMYPPLTVTYYYYYNIYITIRQFY